MKYRFFFLIVLVSLISAVDCRAESPRWSISLKGGYFEPDTDDWKDHYHHEGFWMGGLEIGWKIIRQLELSTGILYGEANGDAVTVTGRKSNDDITFSEAPVNVSLIFRFVFSEDQIVVPYFGGGYTHVFYWEKLNGSTKSGDQGGYHVRGGVQFLLDPLEPGAAQQLNFLWGIKHTYFFIEGMYSKVDDFGSEDVDLGSRGLLGGVLIEF